MSFFYKAVFSVLQLIIDPTARKYKFKIEQILNFMYFSEKTTQLHMVTRGGDGSEAL